MFTAEARKHILKSQTSLQVLLESVCVNPLDPIYVGYCEEEKSIMRSKLVDGEHRLVELPQDKNAFSLLEINSSSPVLLSREWMHKNFAFSHLSQWSMINAIELVYPLGPSSNLLTETPHPLRALDIKSDKPALRQCENYSSLDAILIDDDPLVHKTWEFVAKRLNKKMLGFRTAELFYEAAHLLPKASPVYVDLHLGKHDHGDIVSAYACLFGFQEIHIQSGLASEALSALPWITAIHGKATAWEKELITMRKST